MTTGTPIKKTDARRLDPNDRRYVGDPEMRVEMASVPRAPVPLGQVAPPAKLSGTGPGNPKPGRMTAAQWRERLKVLLPVPGAKMTLSRVIPDTCERNNVRAVGAAWPEFAFRMEHMGEPTGPRGRGPGGKVTAIVRMEVERAKPDRPDAHPGERPDHASGGRVDDPLPGAVAHAPADEAGRGGERPGVQPPVCVPDRMLSAQEDQGGDGGTAKPTGLGSGPLPRGVWRLGVRRCPWRKLAERIRTAADWFEWPSPPKYARSRIHGWKKLGMPVKSYRLPSGSLVVCHKDAEVPR